MCVACSIPAQAHGLTERYRCLNEACKHEWPGRLGPVACPECNSVWVEWITHRDE
jgi:hypothetical protein